MHLKSITLAGFKSFADKTKLPLTADITAVIGPNGCGKSNVIDAMRWVIGETSAKQLRGGSMADVIFNGAGTRPAGAKASVELLLDNSDKRLLGEYAAFNEISIRREVLRDGQSKYIINGTTCRRRDVLDLFLGTGLGPRSYSIIEQGMISKLIEAKPEELRVYIEEAAGISKYKERRRETSNRMRHTSENCERLEDMRLELGKRLSHLKRQANAANRYKELKEQETTTQNELQALQWSKLATELEAITGKLTVLETAYESHKANKVASETELTASRIAQTEANEKLQVVQKSYYAHETEIARAQQQIQNAENNIAHLESELAQSHTYLANQDGSRQQQTERLTTVRTELEQQSAAMPELQATLEAATMRLQTAESSMQEWRNRWDDLQLDYATASQAVQKGHSQLELIQSRNEQRRQTMEQLEQELAEINPEVFATAIEQVQAEISELEMQQEQYLQRIGSYDAELEAVTDDNQQLKQELPAIREQLSQTQGKLEAMLTLQQASLGHYSEKTQQWLEENGLQAHDCVLDKLKAESKYSIAVEMVLYELFDAICIDSNLSLTDKLAACPEGMIFIQPDALGNAAAHSSTKPVLADFVNAPWNKLDALQRVWVAENLAQAEAWRKELPAHHSVITPDGIWMTQAWVKKTKCQEEDENLLQRQQLITEHEAKLEQLQQQLATTEDRLQQGEDQLNVIRDNRDAVQEELQQAKIDIATLNTKLHNTEQQQQQAIGKSKNYRNRLESMQADVDRDTSAKSDLQGQLGVEQSTLETLEATRAQLRQERSNVDENLVEAREEQQYAYREFEKQKLEVKSKQDEVALLQGSLEQIAEQRASLQEQISSNTDRLSAARDPLGDYKDTLQEHMMAQSEIEDSLRAQENKLAAVNAKCSELENRIRDLDNQLSSSSKNMEGLKLDQASLQVRQQTIEEHLQEENLTVAQIKETMAEEANIKQWETDLASIQTKIQRLGAINLAAIEEYAQLEERKVYLDQQYEDLMKALELLQNAIAKIDRETKVKFKHTYDRLNEAFQKLFPRIFSGGAAYLSLTGDDMLTAGVAVHAQPPGKKNSTIHMLSGGEKAMTAVSLVFALFQLNPAPICILDEVDAPLDDANVGRFIQLVREMSKAVQFIVISHNKLTIEGCDNLLGVTQKEAGVSRIVSVNLEQAVDLVE